MATIYDLATEGGGQILTDSDSVQAALQVNSNAAGYPAISILSTASGSAVQISGIQGDGIRSTAQDANAVGGRFLSLATTGNALIVGKSVKSGMTIAALKFLGTSVASGALMQFAGGFISCTSISLAAGAGSVINYALPVVVGGEVKYIPLVDGGAITGGAAF